MCLFWRDRIIKGEGARSGISGQVVRPRAKQNAYLAQEQTVPSCAPLMRLAERTVRKVSLRLLPFLFLLYVVAFLDRVNFGYAALEMNSALGLSAEVFGFLSGIFFIGYLIFEIPSNMILQRIGARIWISRIIISWGIVVIVTAAATDAFQLAALRFILGVAEAGFFPGVILYITCWFRRQELARAVALFMTALAVSNIIGAPLSTWILDNIHWFGIAGWRWLFILEGLPALVLGVVTWFYLTDRPKDAAWLEPEEREWLTGVIARENAERAGTHHSFRTVIRDLRIWHLGCIYCAMTIGLYGLGFWMPQIIRSLNPAFSNFEIGLVMTIPYLAALVSMIAWSAHSDRTGERVWHAAVPPLVGGIALAGAGLVSSPAPRLRADHYRNGRYLLFLRPVLDSSRGLPCGGSSRSRYCSDQLGRQPRRVHRPVACRVPLSRQPGQRAPGWSPSGPAWCSAGFSRLRPGLEGLWGTHADSAVTATYRLP